MYCTYNIQPEATFTRGIHQECSLVCTMKSFS